MTQEAMLKLIEAGIMAPSADNMQPWKFRFDENSLELSLDREQLGHFFDPADVATEVGCGALIENIDQYAQHLGLALSIERNPAGDKSIVAKLRFSPLKEVSQPDLANEVFTRCTDRGLYDRKRVVKDIDRKVLDASLKSSPDFTLTFYDDPLKRKAIIRTVYQADTIRFSHEAIHHDFYNVLRFGESAESTRDGLAQSTLGVEFFFIPVLKFLRSWRLTRLLNKVVGLHHMMALRGVWLPMIYSSSLVSIVHQGPADYLEFGRAMEKFWLQATRCGLSVQPLGAFPLFLARLQTVNGEGFSASQISRLRQLEQGFAECTPAYQSAEGQLVMLFRIGYAKRSPSRSLRRSVESFLL